MNDSYGFLFDTCQINFEAILNQTLQPNGACNKCVYLYVLAEMYCSALLPPYTWACTDIVYSDILGNGVIKSGNIIKELKIPK